MLDFHSFFCRLFFVCAAALLCEVLSENTQSSSGKGLSAAIKTVCALCVCVSVFSFFGNITGKGNFDISTFFALPEVSEEQVRHREFFTVTRKNKSGIGNANKKCRFGQIRHKSGRGTHRLDCKQEKQRHRGHTIVCFAFFWRRNAGGTAKHRTELCKRVIIRFVILKTGHPQTPRKRNEKHEQNRFFRIA